MAEIVFVLKLTGCALAIGFCFSIGNSIASRVFPEKKLTVRHIVEKEGEE